MPNKEQVLALFGRHRSYQEVGRVLGVPPGQAFMIATGLPADGGNTFVLDGGDQAGDLSTSPQHLVHPSGPAENPTTKPHLHQWVKCQAGIDVAMQAAAQARGAAPGKPLEAEKTGVSTVLTRDHDQVTAMLKQLKTIPGVTKGGSPVHQSRRESIVDMITVAPSKHEASEEEHFWPVVRSLLPDGEALADTALEQEQRGKEVLAALGPLSASDEKFDELAEELDALARKHVAFEDRVLLALGEAMSQQDAEALGRRLLEAQTGVEDQTSIEDQTKE